MVPEDILLSPRLKAQRANQHINELMDLVQPLAPSLYEIVIETNILPLNMRDRGYKLTYRPKQPIPETLALIIGDAIHNLRASLDHLASAIIRTQDPDAKPYFPVTQDRQKLPESGSLAQMEAALPGSRDVLLDKIRPVNSGKDHLWAFSVLDIEDKHNLVIPVVTIADIRNINVTCGTNRIAMGACSNNAAKPFTLVRTNEKMTAQGDPETIVNVEFGDGTALKGYPVIPTLLDIAKIVEETLVAFFDLIKQRP